MDQRYEPIIVEIRIRRIESGIGAAGNRSGRVDHALQRVAGVHLCPVAVVIVDTGNCLILVIRNAAAGIAEAVKRYLRKKRRVGIERKAAR